MLNSFKNNITISILRLAPSFSFVKSATRRYQLEQLEKENVDSPFSILAE